MATPSLVGRRLGQYLLLEQIGSGGMGVVYRARDEKLQRDVAIKIMRAGALADENARKRFQQEALALSSVSHPHIATIHDFGSEDGLDYIVMEWIEGVSLDTLLQKGPLAPEEAVWMALQVARALAAAHERGIIHRDLKPGNIRILPDGHVKLLDFGLAKALRADTDARTVSVAATQGVMGTVPYMAPEQLRGEPLDARSDIWAAGAVLYETATGRRPFPDSQAMEAILTQQPAPPGQVNRRVPNTLEALILKALEKEPRRRFQSAREMLAALEAIQPATRGLDNAPARPAARPAWLVGGIALVALLAALLGWYGWSQRKGGASGKEKIEALAVLPLENLSGKAEEEFFADGMTEELIANLAKLKDVRVISRTSVMQYKNARKPLPEIARELNVDAVIEGSVLRAGERVRITTQLIEAATDRHLWAQSYERDLKDVLALQSEVARAIAREVHGTLAGAQNAAAPKVDPRAYEAYLLGLSEANSIDGGQARAIQRFEEAVRIDPAFAAAHAALAKAQAFQFFMTGEAQWETKAMASIERTLELDPANADAYLARGNLLWTINHGFPHERAAAEYRRALELNPNLGAAHYARGALLMHVGVLDKAEEELQFALAIEPTNDGQRYRLARTYLYNAQYDKAVAEFDKLSRPAWQRAVALLHLGRMQEARSDVDQLEGRVGGQDLRNTYDSDSIRALILALEGKKQGARALNQRVLEVGRGQSHLHHAAYIVATSYALIGDHSDALRVLRLVAETGMPCYDLFLKDPYLDSLRPLPEFQKFMAEQKALWERHREVL